MTKKSVKKSEQENVKKCKICVKSDKKPCKSTKNKEKSAENTLLPIYIKVLLRAYKSLPKIISVVDSILEQRAYMPKSLIYGSAYSTYDEINQVIDLSDRKSKLLNLYVMAQELIKSLDGQFREIALLKFVKNMDIVSISQRVSLSERSVFRRLNQINEILADYVKNNFNFNNLKRSIDEEPWLESMLERELKTTEPGICGELKTG